MGSEAEGGSDEVECTDGEPDQQETSSTKVLKYAVYCIVNFFIIIVIVIFIAIVNALLYYS